MNAGSPEPLLSDLSLQLPANQLGLIYGRSGAGKTTLLQLLAGLTESSSGQIRLGVGTHQLDSHCFQCSIEALPARAVKGRTLWLVATDLGMHLHAAADVSQ